VQVSALAGSNLKAVWKNKTMDFSGFASLSINPSDRFGVELGYNLGLVPFSDVKFTSSTGQDYINGNFKNKYLYLLAKVCL
jgi:hypothetical protein